MERAEFRYIVRGIKENLAGLKELDLSLDGVRQDLIEIKHQIEDLINSTEKPTPITCRCKENSAKCTLHWKGIDL